MPIRLIRRTVLTLSLLLLMAVLAQAATVRTIHVELSYAGEAASYRLYQDGSLVCTSAVAGATQMDCDIAIGEEPITFALTAVDSAGVESPQSAPYVLTPPAIDPVTGNALPQAVISASATSGAAPLLMSVEATASSDIDGIVTAQSWDFGDGVTASGELADHTYTAPGVYSLSLLVQDDGGGQGQAATAVTVSDTAQNAANQPPVAIFAASQVQDGSAKLAFDAKSSSDPDGAIASYLWDFGDGDTASGVTTTHQFASNGDYTVRLTVTDGQGVTAIDQLVVSIVDPPKLINTMPVAGISVATEKRRLHFAWEYNGTDPGLAGFTLYQNNHKLCEVADPLARQAECLDYVDIGQVRLWVTARNQAGGESAPASALTFDSTGLIAQATGGPVSAPLHFSAGTSGDAEGPIVAYNWNFGDGSSVEGLAVNHLFPAPGTYGVTLTVTDSNGSQDKAEVAISMAVLADKGEAGGLAISQVVAAGSFDAASGKDYSLAAKVSGVGAGKVWASITPALVTPPPPVQILAKVGGQGPTVAMVDADQSGVVDGVFIGSYSGFTANGLYDVVIYASDGNGGMAQSSAQTLAVTGISETTGGLAADSGWSLLSSAIGFEVAKVFGDGQKCTSVWKWQGGAWAVYLPGEAIPGSYATSKGFAQLVTVASGEGFWINSTGPQQVAIPGVPEYGPLVLQVGWNLVGLKSDQSSPVEAVSALQTGVASIWKWENGTWVVSLPGEEVPGSYATSKGFGQLMQINPGEGFWVNRAK